MPDFLSLDTWWYSPFRLALVQALYHQPLLSASAQLSSLLSLSRSFVLNFDPTLSDRESPFNRKHVTTPCSLFRKLNNFRIILTPGIPKGSVPSPSAFLPIFMRQSNKNGNAYSCPTRKRRDNNDVTNIQLKSQHDGPSLGLIYTSAPCKHSCIVSIRHYCAQHSDSAFRY